MEAWEARGHELMREYEPGSPWYLRGQELANREL